MKPKILVAGAGIGGLAAALALRKEGFEVVVVEQSRRLAEVGAGIQISPNASRVLNWLGLEEKFAQRAVIPEAQIAYDWQSGERLYARPMKDKVMSRYGANYYQVHRADLHSTLTEALGSENITLGFTIAAARQDENSVCLQSADGREVSGDLLIGADGLKSVVRKAVNNTTDSPVYTGMTAFRGTFPATKLPEGMLPTASNNWMGPNGHVVSYYLRGQALINLVGIMEIAEPTTESWSAEISRNALMQIFDGWHDTVLTLLGAIDQPFQWGLYGRAPQSVWGQGRITLLGDAAHPMVPFLAQGAGMALEDAAILARCLSANQADPIQAMRRYEDLRRDRTARVQLGALARGNEMHETDQAKIAHRNASYRESQADEDTLFHVFDWIYRYDPLRAAG